ncbi:hypothetical protein FRB96_005687 [Tulasnella sp. 330]|nr:hypothetical protein FRB96_005687 [Tulasnella sp. 330]
MSSSTGKSVGLGYLPSAQALITADASLSPPSSETRAFLVRLSNAAHDAGAAIYCSSILGGQGSESDQFSDCAIYLGVSREGFDATGSEEGRNKALSEWVAEAVGLGGSIPKIASFKRGTDGPSPVSLETVPDGQKEKAKASISTLEGLLKQLSDVVEFRIHGADAGEPNLHFMIGKDGIGAWQGLMGASVWSDD